MKSHETESTPLNPKQSRKALPKSINIKKSWFMFNLTRRVRILLVTLILVALLVIVLSLVYQYGGGNRLLWPSDPVGRAHALLKSYPLIDGHNDLGTAIREKVDNQLSSTLNLDVTQSSFGLHTDIPRLRQGQVGGVFWAAYISCAKQGKDAVRASFEQIDVIKRFVAMYNATFGIEIASSSQAMQDTFGAGKVASMIGVEGGHMIDSSIAVLRMYYDLGVRYFSFLHNCDVPWAGSCCSAPEIPGKGLSAFGETIVNELNRIGMIIDLSHASVRTMNDVLDTSRAPVIFSHSGAYTLCNSSRNVPDSVLLKLKSNNGLVMVVFNPPFITCSPHATMSDVVNHIMYIGKMIGFDKVGIGSDFDGISQVPIGLEDVSTYPDLVAELFRRGLSDSDIINVVGGNVLRVWREVEEIRDSLAMRREVPFDEWIKLNATACRTIG